MTPQIHPRRRIRFGGSLEDYRRKIERGEYQLFNFPLGQIVTEIQDHEDGRVLFIVLLAGKDFDSWKEEATERLSRFGIEHACVAIEALCRPGLEKKIRSLGARRVKVMMRKELSQ